MTTITSPGGTAEIVVTRPTVGTLRTMGLRVGMQGTTANLPPGLAMQVFGSGLGGGNARASVTTFSDVGSLFKSRNPLSSLGSRVFDISLLDENGPVRVSNLNLTNRFMFELQRINSVSLCYWILIGLLLEWSQYLVVEYNIV